MLDADGNPVPNVKIWPLPETNNYSSYHGLGPPVTTAADGSFTITATQFIGPYQLGRTPQLQLIYHGNVWGGARLVGTKAIDLSMPQATKMRAVFLDPSGNPVGGMKVGIELLRAGFPEENAIVSPPTQLTAMFQKTTDASGAAEWDDLPREWEVYVNWTDRRFAQPFNDAFGVTADAEVSSDLIVHLHDGASIHGRVTFGPGGPPAAGVHLRTNGEVTRADLTGFINATVETDSDGKYAFDQLLPGVYATGLNLAPDDPLEKKWTAPIVPNLTLAPRQTMGNQDFVLEKGGAITGIVTDAQTGAPIPEAYLNVQPAGGNANGIAVLRTETDGNGRYILHMPPGKVSLTLESTGDGYDPTETASRTIDVGNAQTVVENFKMQRVLAPLLMNNTVTYQNGSPAVGALVFVVAADGWMDRQYTDPQGRFPQFARERILYHARLGSMDSKSVTNSTGKVHLVLQPGLETEMTGKVVGEDGSAIAGATIRASMMFEGHMMPGAMERETDASGTFHIRHAWPDVTYRLSICWWSSIAAADL
jgi:hypothetical protein